jgi:enoyl-CoA hydratase/carnithine racemase
MRFEGNDAVRYERRDQKAYITLDRPEVLNAHNREMRLGLLAALADLRDDPDLRVGIITGAGGRAFAAGHDLKELATPEGQQAAQDEYDIWDGNWTDTVGLYKPLVAAIDGYALGGGFEIALKCDIRIATEQSVLGRTEARFFAASGTGGYSPRYLAAIAGVGVALYMQLTAAQVPAETCLRWGLIHEMLPDRDALLVRADEIADLVLQCKPGAAEGTKHVVWDTLNQPIEYVDKYARALGGYAGAAPEISAEGAHAFAEQRAAR